MPVAGILALIAAAVTILTFSDTFLYPAFIGVLLTFGAVASTNLKWMLDAWRTPSFFSDNRLGGEDLAPAHSFSLIVPARHEEAVLEATLSRLVASDHPAFEVLVVVGADDTGTLEVAERVADRYPDLVRVVVDPSWPKNKPRALNAALPHCAGSITGVFDAEDIVHPALLRRIDSCLQRTHADVVQAGVQLMNFQSSWLTVRNVLEYYFWFRSRLHRHASQRFIPLGGNTVFIRTDVLLAVSGWDSESLAEDCELGVRLSSLGAKTVVVYEPDLVTREECPPTLRAFTKQRTRWNQGYLQTLVKGYWRRLPLRQRALGVYILATPYLLALAWVMAPVAIVTAILVSAPVPITLISFVPAVPMLAMLAVEIAGLGDFCRTYGARPSGRDYARLVVGLPLYQAVLAFAAARAVTREVRGARGWEKTAHMGLHLAPAPEQPNEPSRGLLRVPLRWSKRRQEAWTGTPVELGVPMRGLAEARADLGDREVAGFPAARLGLVDLNATALKAPHNRNGFHDLAAGEVFETVVPERANGHRDWWRRPTGGRTARAPERRPLWMRLGAVSADGSGAISLPRRQPGSVSFGGRGLADLRLGVQGAVTAHADAALQVVLLAVVGVVLATNLLHWPVGQFDEGTYVSQAWAVQHGKLAPYTYSYGHPPLAWLLIAAWTWAGGLFGHGSYTIDEARGLMVVVNLVSCSLLYTLARRLGIARAFAAGAVILFALSPLDLFYHRAVLLDNPSIAWALAAFVLARTPQRRIWAFAASGACFAAAVLSKETTVILLPALLVAAAQNSDQRTRRYCLTLFIAMLLVTVAFYPLYAALKGELVPGPGHVSLLGYTVVQLFTRTATGSIFDPHSQTHAIVTQWLKLDPWLLGAALALSPIALLRRSTRALVVAFLAQVLTVFRPGYLPSMYVIGLLPFAALIVAGSADAVWRRWRAIAAQTGAWPGGAAIAVGGVWRKWRAIAARAGVWLVGGGIAVPALVVVVIVAGRWGHGDRVAMTLRADTATRAADRWLVEHVDHQKRLIVGDEIWIYLVEHGFNHQAMPGGFFSRTVVSYWPLDYDPAVKRQFPDGWRDFDYIVSTQAIRDTTHQTPTAAAALVHSRVIVTFGSGVGRVEIRAITRGAGQ